MLRKLLCLLGIHKYILTTRRYYDEGVVVEYFNCIYCGRKLKKEQK